MHNSNTSLFGGTCKRVPLFNTGGDMDKKRPDRVGEMRTAYEKNRLVIRKTQTVCGICGQPVDFSYKTPHPLSWTVDHIIPVSKGGHPSDLQNLQLAHRWCNRQKSDKIGLTMRRAANESEDEGSVNNDDLPLHYDWTKYKAQ